MLLSWMVFAYGAPDWRVEYDGYGHVSRGPAGEVVMEPHSSQSPGETHAALVLAHETEVKPLRDFRVSVVVTVESQLRAGNPNPWEVFWLFFNYRKTSDGKETNYFLLKPNGVEVGRAFGESGQAFIYTAEKPRLPAIGKPLRFVLTKKGQSLSVSVDGQPALQLDASKNPPGLYDQPGAIALYTEDARVRVHSVRIESLDG